MSEAFKERLTKYYQFYAPDKVANVDNLVVKYAGKEDVCMTELQKRYGPESAITAGGSGAKKAPASPAGKAPASKPASKAAAPAGAAKPASAAAAEPPGTEPAASSTAAPAGSKPSDAAAATPKANDSSGPAASGGGQKSGDNNANNNNDNNDDEPEEDVEDALRLIVSKSGFLCQEHEHRWVQTWLGSLPLSLLTRETVPGKNPVIIQAWGYKHARKGLGGPWKRRFFLVVPPFLYYSDNDQPSCKCRGCVYLARADVKEELKDAKQAIAIESRVNRRPDALDSSGDAAPYFIAFETERVRDTWKTVLEKVAKAPYNLTTGHIENPQSKASAAGVAGGSGTPIAGSPRAVQAALMMQGLSSPFQIANNNNGGNSNSSVNALQMQPSWDFNSPGALQHAASATLPPTQQPIALQAPLGVSTPLLPQQMQQHAQQQPAPAPAPPAPQPTPQPHTPHHVTFAPIVQSGAPAASAALAPIAATATTTTIAQTAASFQVDMRDLMNRIKRLASERDPAAVIDLLFNHVESFPGDFGTIWKLMLAIDDAPRPSGPTPEQQQQLMILMQQQQQQQQQRGGGGLSSTAYGQQQPSAQQRSQAANDRWNAVTAAVMAQRGSSPPRQQHQQQQQGMVTNASFASRGPSETPSDFFAPVRNPSPPPPPSYSQQQQQAQSQATARTPQQQQQQSSSPRAQPAAAAANNTTTATTGSRSNSFDLLPLSPGKPIGGASNNSATPQQQQQAGGGRPALDSVSAALERSSNRRQMIDQMLNGLPK